MLAQFAIASGYANTKLTLSTLRPTTNGSWTFSAFYCCPKGISCRQDFQLIVSADGRMTIVAVLSAGD